MEDPVGCFSPCIPQPAVGTTGARDMHRAPSLMPPTPPLNDPCVWSLGSEFLGGRELRRLWLLCLGGNLKAGLFFFGEETDILESFHL